MKNYPKNWDLRTFFPSFEDPRRKAFREKAEADLAKLTTLAAKTPILKESCLEAWVKIFVRDEELVTRLAHYGSYIGCLCAADARNEAYQAENGVVARLEAEFEKLEVEMKRALKGATKKVFAAFLAHPRIRPIAFAVQRMRERARKTMDPALETLAAELGVDGLSAWGRLYNQIAGKLEFTMEFPDGRKEVLPMARRRSLMEDVDPKVRRAAFVNGNAAWAKYEDVTAAAINHISGTRLLLNKRRGIDHFLDVALFQSCISRGTLDAMFAAIEANRPFLHKLGRAKAKALGQKNLHWYDLDAPLPLKNARRFTWNEGVDLVGEAFEHHLPELKAFYDGAIAKRWVESEPRAGKRPGAFCTGSPLIGESRVFMTFDGSLGDVQTLAHEIGHAYHSHQLRDRRTFAQFYPMTLAETASTFAEAVLTDGLLANPKLPDAEKANLLNTLLGHSLAFLFDIPIRFRFEKALHEEREKGEVSVSRLKELMASTQRQVLGDLLAKDGEDPYFWASKLHFYITEVTFYNFPYTFGYLLSRGLFQLFRKQGPAFIPKYHEFLRLSGSDSAENVARRSMGVSLEGPEFWSEAIKSLEPDLAQYEALLPKVLKKS